VIAKDTPNSYESYGRIKRLSSLTIPAQQSLNSDRREYYGLFNNIENKQSPSKVSMNVSEIDKKIE